MSQLTPKQINDLKIAHNEAQDKGSELYKQCLMFHKKCLALQDQIRDAEGDDYDDLPLIFGAGFWIDESLK